MTDRLLPCPFCGGEAHYDRGRLTGISAVVCPCSSHVFFGAEKSRDATIAAWNTRTERTCRAERRDSFWGGYTRHCGSCGADLDCDTRNSPQRYCPNCGAKVVSE